MRPVLFLQNITLEDPASMIPYLEKRNISFEIRDLYAGQPIPDSPENYGAIVVLGGPMNVDEEEKYGFLQPEKEFIRNSIEQNIPVLGLCLGGQLVARSLGAFVKKNPKPEIGWMNVDLTKQGCESRLFQDLPTPLPVFQWHGDTFDLPDRAIHLAFSADCLNQAFAFHEKAFALQFHLEIDEQGAKTWARAYENETHPDYLDIVRNLIEQPDQKSASLVHQCAQTLFKNFFINICGYSDVRLKSAIS